MNRASPEFAAVEVLDSDGNPHLLGEAWAKRPAVLSWLRHFG